MTWGIYVAVAPTLVTGQPYPIRLDSAGRILVSSGSGLATETTLAAVRDRLPSGGMQSQDVDTGAGTNNALSVSWRKTATGAPEFGTATDPVRTDPTGTTTQPISASSLPLPSGAATETTVAAVRDRLPSGGLTSQDVDTGAGTNLALSVSWRRAGVGAAEFGTVTDPVRTDPTGTTTQPISASSLPLPSGAATETTVAAVRDRLPSGGMQSQDVDTGAGTNLALSVSWRKTATGAPEFGTATDPVRTDPTGTTTQPVQSHATAGSGGAWSIYSTGSGGLATNGAVIKASAGRIRQIRVTTSALVTGAFLQVHNLAAVPTGGEVPADRIFCPARTAENVPITVVIDYGSEGAYFSTGLTIAPSTTIGTYTAPGATELHVFAEYI